MKKILILALLCSTLFCQAKDFYYEGISFEYASRMNGGIKLRFRGYETENSYCVTSLPYLITSSNNLVELLSISCTKNSKNNPEKKLTEIMDKTMEESANMPRKQRVKSISDIQDGMVGNYPCKFIDIEKPKGHRIRVYCFKKGNYFIQLTINWFGVKKLEKFEKVIENLRVIDTFEFMPE